MIKVNKAVDVIVFAGQSNMSGRGNAANATLCDEKAGFEYKAVSNPEMLVPITEPFGLNEDKAGAIYDLDDKGMTKRSGSMVSSAINEYYAKTKRQVIAISASIGGTSTTEWKKNYINDAVWRLDRAKAFLQKKGINIDHIFVVWCQGETDGDTDISASVYTQNTIDLFETFKQHGAEICFLVQTGHYNYIGYPNGSCSLSAKAYDERYTVIRNAQAALCENNDNFILAGSFEGYITDMIDQYHYNQRAYNEVGKSVGKAMSEWVLMK